MNKLKNFLIKKRCKSLKLLNNKGFSLVEVLVAITIIGIISAIAIPQFKDYRDKAASVASDTSASNIVKAFQNCLVLNSFANCLTLSAIGMSCPAGSVCNVGNDTGNTKFCADVKKGKPGSEEILVCVELDTNGNEVKRTYAGTLLKKVCNNTQKNNGAATCTATAKQPSKPLKFCKENTECAGHGTATSGDCLLDAHTCDAITTTGKCGANTGLCS